MTHLPSPVVSPRQAISRLFVVWRFVIAFVAAGFASDTARGTVDLEMLAVYMPESNISPSRQAVAGNYLSAAFNLRNVGTTTAAPSYCEVRITKSPVSSGSAADVVEAFVFTHYSLDPGKSVDVGLRFRAPTEPGVYYIWVIADAKKQFVQVNTVNDAGVSEPLTVHSPDTVPNFELTTLVIDKKSASPGEEITATWSIVNSGKGAAPPTSTWVAFSDDPTENPGGFFTEITSPALAPGASFVQSATFKIPDDAKLGKGFVWLDVAANNWPKPLETDPFDNELHSKAIKIVAPLQPSPPVITALNPKAISPSIYSLPVTISGKNFQPGVSLLFDPPTGPDIPGNPLKLTYRSIKSLEYAFNNAEDTGTWTVRAKNPDGSISAPFAFEVKGSQGPEIHEVTPDPVLPTLALQTITINGSGFLKGASLLFDPPSAGVIKGKAARIVSFSDTRIVYQLNNAANIGPWTVQVQNPGKAPSQPRTFHVGSTSAPTAPENKEMLVEAIRLARGSLDAEQEQCIRLVFDEFAKYGDGDTNKLIYLMASIWHESRFRPIPEGRIDSAVNPTEFARQEQYWHTGYFGRGYLQLTHEANYRVYGRAIGVDLLGEVNREKALIPENAAKIAVLGIMAGFTGRPLNLYINAANQDYMQARRSVNGYVEDQARSVFDKNAAIRAALASLQAASPAAPAMAIAPHVAASTAAAGNTPSLTLLEKRGEQFALKYQGSPGLWVQIQHSVDLIHWENGDSFLTPATGEIEVTITPPPQSAQGRIFFRGLIPE